MASKSRVRSESAQYRRASPIVPPFSRYAVIPVARNVWQQTVGESPALRARRLIMRSASFRETARGAPGAVDGAEEEALRLTTDSGPVEALLDVLEGVVVGVTGASRRKLLPVLLRLRWREFPRALVSVHTFHFRCASCYKVTWQESEVPSNLASVQRRFGR